MKKIIAILLTLVLAAALFAGCSAPAQGEEKTLTIGVAGDYFPFCFTESDVLQGFEIDMWKEIGTRAGYKVEFVTSDLVGLLGMLDSGKIDSVGYGVAITDTRKEAYAFSDPYLYSDYNIVTLEGSELKTIEDFIGRSVGVVMGGEGERKLNALCDDKGYDIEVKGYEGPAALDEDIRLGRLDARLAPVIQTAANIKKNNLGFSITDITIYSETCGYPFPKGAEYDELIKTVNEIIADMRADGSLADLSAEWFGIDATNE